MEIGRADKPALSSRQVMPAQNLLAEAKLKAEYHVIATKLEVNKKWRDLSSLDHLFVVVPPPDSTSIRILQWNVLACGLANDGFHVNPVLENWPVEISRFPTTDKSSKTILEMIQEMQTVTKQTKLEFEKEFEDRLRAAREHLNEIRAIQSARKISSFRPLHSARESQDIMKEGASGTAGLITLSDAVAATLPSMKAKAGDDLAPGNLPPAPPNLQLRYSDRSMLLEYGSYDETLVLSALRLQAIFRGGRSRNKHFLKKKYQKKKIKLMQVIQKEFDTPHMARNSRAVMDWEGRWCRLRYQILRAMPDILTLTEVDTLCQMQRDLGALGYECGFAGREYRPMHCSKPSSMSYGEYLAQSGIAYAPNFNSNALGIAMAAAIDQKTVEAAANKMLGEHDYEKKWNPRLLFKEKNFHKLGGTQALFKVMRELDDTCPPPESFDDDCSVIFWRKDRFSLTRIKYLDMSTKKKHKSAVKATLVDRKTGKTFQVITAHLQSGAAAKDNQKRMVELYGPAKAVSSLTVEEGPARQLARLRARMAAMKVESSGGDGVDSLLDDIASGSFLPPRNEIGSVPRALLSRLMPASSPASAASSPGSSSGSSIETAAPVGGKAVKGFLQFCEDSCHSGPCIVSMDANSSPQLPYGMTVWKAFRGAEAKVAHSPSPDSANTAKKPAAQVSSNATTATKKKKKKASPKTWRSDKWRSVWDSFFDCEGQPVKRSEDQATETIGGGSSRTTTSCAGSSSSSKKESLDSPVSVNKMRGSTSEQPQKIGLHAYELIDHIWFSKGVSFRGHAMEPKRYTGEEHAKSCLIPDLVFPTDHMPVVADVTMT